jgi:hypothetical protein
MDDCHFGYKQKFLKVKHRARLPRVSQLTKHQPSHGKALGDEYKTNLQIVRIFGFIRLFSGCVAFSLCTNLWKSSKSKVESRARAKRLYTPKHSQTSFEDYYKMEHVLHM